MEVAASSAQSSMVTVTIGMACMAGDPSTLLQLIQAGESVNRTGHHGIAPLHIACGEGNAECVRVLCAAGADLNNCDNVEGISPLAIACFRFHTECARVLLKAGAVPDLPDMGGISPLHIAASDGQDECVEMLLGAGAPANSPQKSSSAVCPLYSACAGGHLQSVQLLIDAGASPDGAEGGAYASPLAAACLHGHAAIARMLCRAGADVTPYVEDEEDERPLSEFPTVAGQLVAAAARPWSPANHPLYPEGTGHWARALLQLGVQLARTRAVTEEVAFLDVWRQEVMPLLVVRKPWEDGGWLARSADKEYKTTPTI